MGKLREVYHMQVGKLREACQPQVGKLYEFPKAAFRTPSSTIGSSGSTSASLGLPLGNLQPSGTSSENGR